MTYVLHVDENGQYHMETTGEDETVSTVIVPGGVHDAEDAMETQTIVMEGDESITNEEALQQIKEVQYTSQVLLGLGRGY